MEERHNNKNSKSLNLTRQRVEILIKRKNNSVIQKVVKLSGTPIKLTVDTEGGITELSRPGFSKT